MGGPEGHGVHEDSPHQTSWLLQQVSPLWLQNFGKIRHSAACPSTLLWVCVCVCARTHVCVFVRVYVHVHTYVPTHAVPARQDAGSGAGGRGSSIPLPWQLKRLPRQHDGHGARHQGQQSPPLLCYVAPRDRGRRGFGEECWGMGTHSHQHCPSVSHGFPMGACCAQASQRKWGTPGYRDRAGGDGCCPLHPR